MDIAIIVYAKDKEDAFAEAERVVQILTEGEAPSLAYYTMHQDDHPALLAASEEGRTLIQERMASTRRDLFHNLDQIRYGLLHLSNEEIWANIDKRNTGIPGLKMRGDAGNEFVSDTALSSSFLRYLFQCAGAYVGSDVYIYDYEGDGIRDEEHLRDALDKWKSSPGERPPSAQRRLGDQVWIVPAETDN